MFSAFDFHKVSFFIILTAGEVLNMDTITGSHYVINSYVYDGRSLVGPNEFNITVTGNYNTFVLRKVYIYLNIDGNVFHKTFN